MKITVDQNLFISYFYDSQWADNFTDQGLSALSDYLRELEKTTEQEIELDCGAIASEYSEYDTLELINDDYDLVDKDDYITNEEEQEIEWKDHPDYDPDDTTQDDDDLVDNPNFDPEYDYEAFNEAIKQELRDRTRLIEIDYGCGWIIEDF